MTLTREIQESALEKSSQWARLEPLGTGPLEQACTGWVGSLLLGPNAQEQQAGWARKWWDTWGHIWRWIRHSCCRFPGVLRWPEDYCLLLTQWPDIPRPQQPGAGNEGWAGRSLVTVSPTALETWGDGLKSVLADAPPLRVNVRLRIFTALNMGLFTVHTGVIESVWRLI